jgi:hypothetical protein
MERQSRVKWDSMFGGHEDRQQRCGSAKVPYAGKCQARFQRRYKSASRLLIWKQAQTAWGNGAASSHAQEDMYSWHDRLDCVWLGTIARLGSAESLAARRRGCRDALYLDYSPVRSSTV